MAVSEWKHDKTYRLGDQVTIRIGRLTLLLVCMESGRSGPTPPTIVRGGSKAPGREYETAVVRVRDGSCVWKWRLA